jgi:hypothetical protein
MEVDNLKGTYYRIYQSASGKQKMVIHLKDVEEYEVSKFLKCWKWKKMQ